MPAAKTWPMLAGMNAGIELNTTPTFEGRRITRYLGLVASETIQAAHLGKDILARIRDLVGGRSGTYEQELATARTTALAEMSEKAARRGANAVVGVDLDYQVIGNMLMVAASGTAVVVE